MSIPYFLPLKQHKVGKYHAVCGVVVTGNLQEFKERHVRDTFSEQNSGPATVQMHLAQFVVKYIAQLLKGSRVWITRALLIKL